VSELENLVSDCQAVLGEAIQSLICTPQSRVILEIPKAKLLAAMKQLRDAPTLQFEMLIDVAGVDYSEFGCSEWATTGATAEGFSRGVEERRGQSNYLDPLEVESDPEVAAHGLPRFAAVYQLLSITHNRRVMVRAFAEGNPPLLPSVVSVWPSANWYEREAFDLFGILFDGHPDLRRILTDYGFVGHPFRKDFPLIGHVEMRYDAKQQRVIYEPVSIEPRILVPKTIRHDHRYENGSGVVSSPVLPKGSA